MMLVDVHRDQKKVKRDLRYCLFGEILVFPLVWAIAYFAFGLHQDPTTSYIKLCLGGYVFILGRLLYFLVKRRRLFYREVAARLAAPSLPKRMTGRDSLLDLEIYQMRQRKDQCP